MFLAKAQINLVFQADQLVTQKITGTEVTKFDDDFSKLEKASDIYIDLQVKLIFSIFLTIQILHCCGFLTKPKKWRI